MSSETVTLLRTRLRVAATILLVGSVLTLARHTFLANLSVPLDVSFYSLHVATTVILAGVSFRLWWRSAVPIGQLRVAELIVFGMPGALFLIAQYVLTLRAIPRGYFEFPVGPWLVLIYTYALFIPNSFGRASVVIGLMAAAPLILLFSMVLSSSTLAQLVTPDGLITIVLLLVLAAVGGIIGVNRIGALRQAAFEARQLGQYRLKQLIGAGGMGEVYLAEHQLLKRPCVIKLIRPDRAGDPYVLARFQREVRATAKLSHWNIVEIYDYGVTDIGTFYYVMEYLPGMSLAQMVARFGPLPPGRVVYLLRQACNALAEAHASGLIHRDIKPGNIFVAQRGTTCDVVKLLDFGLVKPMTDDQPIHLTSEGGITGSPQFMAPEQALGDREPDARTDIYALGAVAYYLLCGRAPFPGNKPIQVMFAHVHQEVEPPSQHRAEVPADLERVVLCCLAKQPDDRYPDVGRLSAALAECDCASAWSREHAASWWQHQAAASQASTAAVDSL